MLSKFLIRRAELADARIVGAVVVMALGEDLAAEYLGPDSMSVASELAQMSCGQYSYNNALILESVDGESIGAIIGYDGGRLEELRAPTLDMIECLVGYRPNIQGDETSADEFYVDSFGVLPEFRHRHGGEMLLRAMISRVYSEGFNRVGLLVDPLNTRAMSLYRHVGFNAVGFRLFCGHEMIHMTIERQ